MLFMSYGYDVQFNDIKRRSENAIAKVQAGAHAGLPTLLQSLKQSEDRKLNEMCYLQVASCNM